MIKKRTCLVLGAGASKCFGYPLGQELVEKIALGLRKPSNQVWATLKQMGFRDEAIEPFAEHINLSHPDSMDFFLQANPDFSAIGKAAIANVIMRCEVKSHRNNKVTGSDTPTPVHLRFEDNWLYHLANSMFDSFETFQNNQISFIQFNYDRTVEHFLFLHLKHLFSKKSDSEVAAKIKTIPIIHPHGRVGALPWEEAEYSRAYGENIDPANFKLAADSLRVIQPHEAQHDQIFGRAISHLIDAARIFFLGFGFQPDNMEKLLHPEWCNSSKAVLGSGYGFSSDEINRLQSRYSHITIHKSNIISFLRGPGVLE